MSQNQYSYLDSLPLSGEEKAKIKNQGYDSAACLYCIIKIVDASVLTQWLGRDCKAELIAALEKQLTPEELAELNKPVPEHPLGALDPKDLPEGSQQK
jgi:hypothetical protein